MRKRSLLTLAVALLMTSAAHANHYADTYVIPVVGHVNGAFGTTWQTDVVIRNFQTTPLEVQLVVIESGTNTSDNVFPLVTPSINGSVTIGPNDTVLFEDIMNGHRGMAEGVLGSLIIGANAPFAVTSRTYNDSALLGQTIPPSRDFLVNSFGQADNTATAYVPGIINNAAARTNVGFTAGAGPGDGTPMVVEITIRDADGGVVGTRNVNVPAGTFMHYQFAVQSLLPADGMLALGSADFRVAQGEGAVVPYASIIDNATSVATYIMGQLPEPTGTPTAARAAASNVFRNLTRRYARPGNDHRIR